MKKSTFILLIGILLSFSSCDILTEVLNQATSETSLTNSEIIKGLKKALDVGAEASVKKLNVTNGYFKDNAVKIFLPPEAKVIEKNIRKIPGVGQKTMDDLVLKINRSAEDAASQAKPIFINAVKSMSIQDGMKILKGSNTAATTYLRTKTYNQLLAAFKPNINTSLNKKLVGNVSTNQAWTQITSYYNKVAPIIGQKKINSNLGDYVARRALDGLFKKVADEEKKIRANPYNYVSDIIKKVFGYAKNNK